MIASRAATSAALATDMCLWLGRLHETPISSQAAQKILRMSGERLLKKYLGYARWPTRFSTRQPSE